MSEQMVCPRCNGEGFEFEITVETSNYDNGIAKECPRCEGDGWVHAEPPKEGV
jgi:DnaJ-class molecular chaperone